MRETLQLRKKLREGRKAALFFWMCDTPSEIGQSPIGQSKSKIVRPSETERSSTVIADRISKRAR